MIGQRWRLCHSDEDGRTCAETPRGAGQGLGPGDGQTRGGSVRKALLSCLCSDLVSLGTRDLSPHTFLFSNEGYLRGGECRNTKLVPCSNTRTIRPRATQYGRVPIQIVGERSVLKGPGWFNSKTVKLWSVDRCSLLVLNGRRRSYVAKEAEPG